MSEESGTVMGPVVGPSWTLETSESSALSSALLLPDFEPVNHLEINVDPSQEIASIEFCEDGRTVIHLRERTPIDPEGDTR